MKKTISILLSILLITCLFAGCSSSNGIITKKELKETTWIDALGGVTTIDFENNKYGSYDIKWQITDTQVLISSVNESLIDLELNVNKADELITLSSDNQAYTFVKNGTDNNTISEIKSNLASELEMLNIKEVWALNQENQANAVQQYANKMYIVPVTVLNIGTDSFEDITNYNGVSCSLTVKLPSSVLSTLSPRQQIYVVGYFTMSGYSFYLENCFVVDDSVNLFKNVDETELKESVEVFGVHTGIIDRTAGTYAYFTNNRMYFKDVAPTDIPNIIVGEWEVTDYFGEKNDITFFEDYTLKEVTKSGYERDGHWAMWGDNFCYGHGTVTGSNLKFEMRQASMDTYVLYENDTNGVETHYPYAVLVKK